MTHWVYVYPLGFPLTHWVLLHLLTHWAPGLSLTHWVYRVQWCMDSPVTGFTGCSGAWIRR
jgi:hypothetical protein